MHKKRTKIKSNKSDKKIFIIIKRHNKMNQRIDDAENAKYIKELRNLSSDPEFLKIYDKIGIPPPSLNGGLYTGEPFRKNAGHANIPIVPDTGFMVHYALRSAKPPVEALYHYPDGIRPGNNTPIMPGVSLFAEGKYGLLCQNSPRPRNERPCECPKCTCHKYFHL